MAHRSKLVALLVSFFAAAAHAGYALPSDPPGFGRTPSGGFTWTPASNAPTIGGGSPAANGPTFAKGPGPGLPSGHGKPPAAFKMAPPTAAGGGAARFLAGQLARNLVPGLGLALGVAWLAEHCISKEGAAWVLTCGGGTPVPSDGLDYKAAPHNTATWYPSGAEAASAYMSVVKQDATCQSPYTCTLSQLRRNADDIVVEAIYEVTHKDHGAWRTGSFEIQSRVSPCPQGWYRTPAGCIQNPQRETLTPEQIEEIMAPKPLPPVLPGGVPYPLDPLAPGIFNPTDPLPGQNPSPLPWWSPSGSPKPVPNTDPQKYTQPGTKWESKPTKDEPWRLETTPENKEGDDPDGIPEPGTDPDADPGTGGGSQPEPQPDLCEKNPDILACQKVKLGELEAKEIANKQVPLSITPDSGFPTGGACPAPKNVTLIGKQFAFSVQPLCDFAEGIKPILIGFAWLTAALTFLGVARREN